MVGVRVGVEVGAPMGVLVGWVLESVKAPVRLLNSTAPLWLRASTFQ